MSDDYKSYHDSPKLTKAVEVYKRLKQVVLDEFGTEDLTVVHLSSCLLEETFNRAMPNDEQGNRVVNAAYTISTYLTTEVLEEELAQKDLDPFEKGKFVVPGNDEIH